MISPSKHFSVKEKRILNILKKRNRGCSHGLDHLETVLFYALELSKKYKVDQKILIPACLLHDLGRADYRLHGLDSVKKSCIKAKIILKNVGYTDKDIEKIIKVIADHDQPKLKPKTIESKILKDADFLDGFGARGIIRSFYWAGESKRPMLGNIDYLKKGMKERFKNLEFTESRKIARSQFFFAQLFFNQLEKNNTKSKQFLAKYVVFEGVSGTGKETQAKLIKEYFNKRGIRTKIIYHPTDRLKHTLREWNKDKIGNIPQGLLFIADRYNEVQKKLLPALMSQDLVISIRSKISALAYQTGDINEVALFEYIFSFFEPEPDMVFYFKLNSSEAMKRIKKRTTKTGEQKGVFENIPDLNKKQKRYTNINRNYTKELINIDAVLPIKKLNKVIIFEINEFMKNNI